MKRKLYNKISTLLAICFLGTVSAQKFDKKFTERFKVNKDVEIVINTSNTDVNVTDWGKNEVEVQAFIEIEGLSKKAAEKYFKNWNFEALGNKNKVKITSKGSNYHSSRNDFIFFNDMDFNFPDIDLSDFDTIVIPDLKLDLNTDFNFDIENTFENLDDLGENMDKNEKYSFQWNDGKDKIIIKSKKEWEAFKKTKKYKELKKKMGISKREMRKNFTISREKLKKELKKAKLEYKKIDKEKIRKKLAKAKEQLKKIKLNFSMESDLINKEGQKVRIKKRLEIKVPKGATFNLNMRHCKVKLPNTVASGIIRYGAFNADNLNGGKLTIDYSSVKINDLITCKLFLNNVTDAKIASVTNTSLSNNSSEINIFKVNENVTVSDKFGELTIESFKPNFGEFILNLSQSNAKIMLGNTNSTFKYNVNKVKLENKRTAFLNKDNTKNNIIKINGDYSNVVIK